MATYPELHGELVDQPLGIRQRLVVIPHGEVASLMRISPKQEEFTRNVRGTAALAFFESRVALGATGAFGSAFKSATTYLKRLRQLRRLGLDVLYSDLDSAGELHFPPGHPVRDLLYLAHPTQHARYLVAAEFHHRVYEHKVAEAVRLLQHLGASHLRIEHVTGWKSEIAFSAGPAGSKGSGNAGGHTSSESSVLYDAELAPQHRPELPESTIWLAHEPLWQAIAEARMRSGLDKFSLDVTYRQDYGVNAGLVAKIKKAGFQIGGDFARQQDTVWRMTGTFAPLG